MPGLSINDIETADCYKIDGRTFLNYQEAVNYVNNVVVNKLSDVIYDAGSVRGLSARQVAIEVMSYFNVSEKF